MKNSTAATWRACRSCDKPLAGTRIATPGRAKQYCSDACRQAGHRARKADPEGWEAKQEARDKRQRDRQRREERAERKHQEWLANLRLGYERMAAMTEAEYEAEYQARLRQLEAEAQPADAELIFADPKIRKMLARAVAGDNEAEALVAFEAARRAYRRITK